MIKNYKIYKIYTDGGKEFDKEFNSMDEVQQYLKEVEPLLRHANLQEVEVKKVVTLQGNQGDVEFHQLSLCKPKTEEEILAIADDIVGIMYEGIFHYVAFANTDKAFLGNYKPNFQTFTIDINFKEAEDFADFETLYVKDLAGKTDVGFFKAVNFWGDKSW